MNSVVAVAPGKGLSQPLDFAIPLDLNWKCAWQESNLLPHAPQQCGRLRCSANSASRPKRHQLCVEFEPRSEARLPFRRWNGTPAHSPRLHTPALAKPDGHLMPADVTSSIMSRTTLDLDPSVLRDLRRRSRDQGKSMGQVASELLARSLREGDGRPAGGAQLGWISRDLGRPRVDLEDKEAVRSVLDASR